MNRAAFRPGPVMWFFFAAVVIFGGQLLFDAWLSSGSLTAPVASPERANMLATGFSRSSNQLVALIMTSIVLAIPLTANMYTPKLIEMFITHPVNRVVLPFFVFTMAQSNFALFAITRGWVSRLQINVLLVVQSACFVLLIPYFYFVIRFIDPGNIIERVTARALSTVDRVGAGTVSGIKAKEELVERMNDLTNIALRAIDRSDREVAAAGLWGLRRVARRYSEVKPSLPPEWFAVEKRFFAGLSAEAVQLLSTGRMWVEQKYLSDLGAAFLPALAKIPDIVSAISDIGRLIALDASSAGDAPLLEHVIRHFNTILREAIKHKNVHATFDIIQNYKLLATEIIDAQPQLLPKIGSHFCYYGQAALAGGFPFIHELAGYDLGEIVRMAFEKRSECCQELLNQFLSLGRRMPGGLSVRLLKARVILCAFLLRARWGSEAERIIAETIPVSEPLLSEASRDLLETCEPYFWEITDRQVNLDYTPEEHRESVREVLSRMRGTQARQPDAPPTEQPQK